MNFGKIFSAIAVVVLAAATMFAQDGRTKVNFYNHTDSSLRFMLNGSPVCTGDVIPNGYCTEPVNPGTYTATATNGQQTTGGQTFTINYGESYDYSVSMQQSNYEVPAGKKLANYRTVANLDYHMGFIVNAPIILTTDGPTQGTTHAGVTYTATLYSGAVANGDGYFVSVNEYPFAVANDDLQRATEGFRASLNARILNQTSPTVTSGQPSLLTTMEAQQNGRTLRIAFLVTYKGNKAFMFAFFSYLDTPNTDVDAVATFFGSVQLN